MNRRGLPRTIVWVLAAAVIVGGIILWRSGSSPPTFDDLSPGERASFRQHLEQARDELRLGNLDGAEADLLFCMEIYGRDPEVLTPLAKVHLTRRLKTDPDRTPDDDDALVDRALAALDAALDVDPDHIPALLERHRIRGDPTLRRYDPGVALADAEEVLRLAPNDDLFRGAVVLWLLSHLPFLRHGKGPAGFDSGIGLDVAERLIRWEIDREGAGGPAYIFPGRELCTVQILRGDLEGALETVSGLKECPPLFEDSAFALGYVLFRLGRYEQAAIALQEGEETLEKAWLLSICHEKIGREPEQGSPARIFLPPPDEGDPGRLPKLRFEEIGRGLPIAKLDGAGSCAFADVDGDGDPDIVAGGLDAGIALYRNDGDAFSDVTGAAGLAGVAPGASLSLVDHDDDGDLDIYICRAGRIGPAPNILLSNDGAGRFVDRSRESSLDDAGSGSLALWADFDGDGLLDVFIANGALNDGSTNRLYRNGGGGVFEDVTGKAGLEEPRTWGTVGAAVGDYDRDGDPDLFLNGRWEIRKREATSSSLFKPRDTFSHLMNDRREAAPNRLYRNRGDGVFDEVAEEAGLTAPPHNGSIAFFLDYDNDAFPDILAAGIARRDAVLDALSGAVVIARPEAMDPDVSRLYRNDRDGTFTEVTFGAGLTVPRAVTGGDIADLDNDGRVDILLGTGRGDPWLIERDVFLHNEGNGTFRDLARLVGLGILGCTRGVSLADLDTDGDLDIYVAEGGIWPGDRQPNLLYRNESGSGNHWIHIRLRGTRSNRFAVGAQVTLKTGEGIQYREVRAASGRTGSYPVEFGLGERERVDEVEVLWPGGDRQSLAAPPVDALIEVVEGRDGWEVIHGGRKE